MAARTEQMAIDPRRTEVSDRIVALAEDASVEISPRDGDAFAAARHLLTAGCDVSITWMPNDTIAARVAAAAEVRRAGFEPVPHIAARFLQSRDELGDLLAALGEEAGVHRILLIAGDRSRPVGPFASGLEVLHTGLVETHGVTEVGLALYPEGHPQVAREVLAEAFEAKARYLAAAGLAAFGVTQLCFDAGDIARALEGLRRSGHTMPVRVGLAGPASFSTLARFAVRCGVGPSAKAILGRSASIARLLSETGPDPIIRDLAERGDLEALSPLSLHFFPFGGLLKTASFIHALKARRFGIPATQSGLELGPQV